MSQSDGIQSLGKYGSGQAKTRSAKTSIEAITARGADCCCQPDKHCSDRTGEPAGTWQFCSDVLSSAQEREYAASLVRQMRAYELLVEDPLINGFFSDMGYNLVSSSDKPGATFTFVILDQPVINAFAAPGGIVALHSGLILLADTQMRLRVCYRMKLPTSRSYTCIGLLKRAKL